MVSEQEVYDVLTYRWRTGNKIRAKIAEKRGKKRWEINVGSIYSKLDSLVRQGFAEMNERDPTEEERRRRGSNKVSEYRKVSGGKLAYDEIEDVGDLGLVPA